MGMGMDQLIIRSRREISHERLDFESDKMEPEQRGFQLICRVDKQASREQTEQTYLIPP